MDSVDLQIGTVALTEYVGATAGDAAFIGTCLTEADALVMRYVGSADVPVQILDRARLEVGSELFHRRQAPSGMRQFAAPDESPGPRLARDPMMGTYPLLARYVGGGFA